MKRIGFLLLVATVCLSCKQTSGQVDEYALVTKVIINENDCFRCFGGNQILQQLSRVSDVQLVFNGLEDNFINRFLEVNKITLKDGMSIVNDTAVFRSLNTYHLTEAHVYGRNGTEYMAFPFKFGPGIDDVISEMQELSEALFYEQHPLKLDLEYQSGIIKLFVDKEYIVVMNRTANTCEVFDKKGSKLFKIDAFTLDPVSVFPEMGELESVTNYLKRSGIFNCQIEKAVCKGEDVALLVSVPYVEMQNEKVVQEVYPCIVSYTPNDEKPKVLYHSREVIPADIMAVWGKPQIDFQCVDMEYTQDKETVDYFVHSMLQHEGSLQIVESKRINYPSFDRIQSFYYEPKLKDGLFALGHTDYLYDVDRDTIYTLPLKCNLSMGGQSMPYLMVNSDGHVVDWSFDGNDMSVIYYDQIHKECQFVSLKKEAKDFSVTPLSFGEKLKCPYLYMVSPHVFYYLNLENEICAKVIKVE